MMRILLRLAAGTGVAGVGSGLYAREQVGTENFDRSLRFYRVAIPGYINYKVTDYKTKDLPQGERDREFEKLHGEWAHRALKVIMELRGFYIKTGQMAASNIGNAFPETWVRTMEVLQDDVPAKDFSTVRGIVEGSLGRPLEEVFSSFEEKPLGAASIGQVHRAVLKDGGETVVVKVQYPEVEAFFRGDVRTMKYFCALAQPEHVPPLEEIEKQFMTEFDYTKEAQQLDTVRKNLEGPFPDVVVPRPHHDLCTKHVLVMEDLSPATKLADGLRADTAKFARLKGLTVKELEAEEAEKDRVAAAQGTLRHGPTKAEMDRYIDLIQAQTQLQNSRLKLWNNTLGLLPFVPKAQLADARDRVPHNHAELIDRLLEVHGHEILIDGYFNGDPHPGNVLLVHDPTGAADKDKLGLIDYGQVKALDKHHRLLLAKLLVNLVEDNKAEIVRLMQEMGYQTKRNDPDVHYALARVIFHRDDPDMLEGKHVQLFLDELQAKDPVENIGTEYVMVGRVCIMLRGLGHVLNQHRSTAEAWLPLARRVIAEAEGVGGCPGSGGGGGGGGTR